MEFLISLLAGILFIPVKIFIKEIINSLYGEVKESFYRSFGYDVATVLGNIFIGAILGGASLMIIPQHITPNIQIRLVNLVVTPLVIGALVNLSSNIKFNKNVFGFDLINFVSGYTFALAMSGVRFIFAK